MPRTLKRSEWSSLEIMGLRIPKINTHRSTMTVHLNSHVIPAPTWRRQPFASGSAAGGGYVGEIEAGPVNVAGGGTD
jgi:hypothetical protein